MSLTVRDQHYSPFKGSPPSDPLRLEAVTVFVMARLRGDRMESMCGHCGPARTAGTPCNTLNGELSLTEWCASEGQACDHLTAHQDALAALG
jgi:hypothetical protein